MSQLPSPFNLGINLGRIFLNAPIMHAGAAGGLSLFLLLLSLFFSCTVGYIYTQNKIITLLLARESW